MWKACNGLIPSLKLTADLRLRQPLDWGRPGTAAMKCISCSLKRCSREFPAALTEKCEHPPSTCLSCLKGGGTASGLPAYCPECDNRLESTDLLRLKEALHHCDRECAAFQALDILKQREDQAKLEAENGFLQVQLGEVEVTVLDGRRSKLSLSSTMRMREVKELIQQKLQVNPGQQRLLFRGRDLTEDEPDPRWGSLGVPFGEALQLVVIMYETGPTSGLSVRSLAFHLSWTGVQIMRGGRVGTNHLNGSCLVLDYKRDLLSVVDFQRLYYPGIMHGGRSSLGNTKQILTVQTEALPSDVRYLFFTLSGWGLGAVTLSVFQDPSVHLRDGATQAVLASYTANEAQSRFGEALILCCASKDQRDGHWRVQQVGVSSSGNKKDYHPLYLTALDLVSSGRLL
eukprot:s611_g32.t1